MTPKQKAIELVDKFKDYANDCYNDFLSEDDLIYNIKLNAKESALIAVDEILAIFYDDMQSMWIDELNFWHDVKNEIKAL